MRRTVVTYPRRVLSAGDEKKSAGLPACRAWRIIPQAANLYGATAAAVTRGLAPQASVATKDGAWPVWVRLAKPGTRELLEERILVNHQGWHVAPTGAGWRIEVVGNYDAGASGLDRHAYAVEVTDDESQVHPVANEPGSTSVSATVTDATTASPIVGGSFVVVVGAADANAATGVGSTLRLTAVGGDVFYAIDADSTDPANRALLLDGASEYVKGGAALHYSDGPSAGASLYVAQLP